MTFVSDMNCLSTCLNDDFSAVSSSLKVKHFADQAFSRWSTHDDLGMSTWTELLIGFSLLHLVVMLSLSINSYQVCLFCLTFLDKSIISSLCLLVLGICFDTHDSDLLLSLDEKLLGLSLGPIDQSNCISLDFVNNNILLTLSSSQQNWCLLLSSDSSNIFFSCGLQFILLLIKPCSINVLT